MSLNAVPLAIFSLGAGGVAGCDREDGGGGEDENGLGLDSKNLCNSHRKLQLGL